MRPGYDESPINALPPVVWALALPMIASEVVFGLASVGFLGGAQGVGFRLNAMQLAAYFPQIPLRMWQLGVFDLRQAARVLTYPFIHGSLTHALFVIVFTLALGKMIAEQFRPWALLALFFGAAIGGAVIYTVFGLILGVDLGPLIGGYPAVYGLVGGFTFLLWVRLGMEHANRMRAFTLIGMLLLFQLVFGLAFGNSGYSWIAEVGGFCVGFLLCFVLVPGGWGRAVAALRRR
ncbi:rhomboid family intramembrane serine protease [Paracoccus aurantiacus]|uniref:Rhomboid family intramembrane serine protease n=1 Tax=Paracoccus aurantiacus TaxID=2599412 RepID=A0A5C6RZJ9_9RHOB|nr:rhomboid family intramembrane serine protease [Paracoccus aurantiacus]TXB67534.1 rhomboid family intramembrane serine protease [Paracoccus aurantiacus]